MKYVLAFILAVISTFTFAKGSHAVQSECLAKMAYAEARGESVADRRKTMDVIILRSMHKEFPSSICANLTGSQYQWTKKRQIIKEKETYAKIRQEARAVYASYLLGEWRDTTGGAYFFSSNGVKPAKRAFRIKKSGRMTWYGLRGV